MRREYVNPPSFGVGSPRGEALVNDPCYIRLYDVGADEMYQVMVDEDAAVAAALGGCEVSNQPILNWRGDPYPLRSRSASERRCQRESEIRARLRQPKETA